MGQRDSSRSDMKSPSFFRASTFARFYIYGIHGFAIEVMFTALWEFVVSQDWKLPGNTSIWSFPIYGLSAMVGEQMYYYMKPRGVPLLVRGLVYTLWTYCWEFSTGFILKQFGACPWDYTIFEADFMGLITLEYAPLWFLASLVNEQVLLYYTNRLFIGPSLQDEKKKAVKTENNTNTNNIVQQNGHGKNIKEKKSK